MALVETYLKVRIGYKGTFECLLSTSVTPTTPDISTSPIQTPTGAPPTPAPPPVISSVQKLAYEINAPANFNPATADINQILHCLAVRQASGDPQEVFYSSFDNYGILLPVNEISNVQLKISHKLRTRQFKYSVQPNIVEQPIGLSLKIKYVRRVLKAACGIFSLNGKAAKLSYSRKLIAARRSFVLSGNQNGIAPLELQTHRLVADKGYFVAEEPSGIIRPIFAYKYLSSGTPTNLLASKNNYTYISSSQWYNTYQSPEAFPGAGEIVGRFDYNADSNFGYYASSNRALITDPRLKKTPGADWTMEMWVYPKSGGTTAPQALVTIYDAGSLPLMSDNTYYDLNANDKLTCLVIHNNRLKISTDRHTNSGGNLTWKFQGWRHPVLMTKDAWYHITLEVYNGQMNAAVNGTFASLPVKGITESFIQYHIGSSGYSGVTSGSFYGYFKEFYWCFGSTHKHQNFEAPNEFIYDRLGLDTYNVTEHCTYRKQYSLYTDTGSFALYGFDTEAVTIDGGSAQAGVVDIIAAGDANSTYPLLAYDTQLFITRTLRGKLGVFNLEQSGYTSFSTFDDLYDAVALNIVSGGGSIQDVGGYAWPINLGPSAPYASSITISNTTDSLRFYKSKDCYLRIPSTSEAFPITPSGVWTLDFWVNFKSLDSVAELFTFVRDDYVSQFMSDYAEGYTPIPDNPLISDAANIKIDWAKQYSLRIQSATPVDEDADFLNFWDTAAQPTLMWVELPYIKETNVAGTGYVRSKEWNTYPFTFTAGTWQPEINTWYHIALVHNNGPRFNAGMDLYVNGTKLGTGSFPLDNFNRMVTRAPINGVTYEPRNILIGRGLDGYIQNLRVTRGKRRFTANFSPDTYINTLGYGDPYFTTKVAALAMADDWEVGKEGIVSLPVDTNSGGANDWLRDYSGSTYYLTSGQGGVTPEWTNTGTDSNGYVTLFEYPDIPSTRVPFSGASTSKHLTSTLTISQYADLMLNAPDHAFPKNRDFCFEAWYYYHALPAAPANNESPRTCFVAYGTKTSNASHTTPVDCFLNAGYKADTNELSLLYGASDYTALTEVKAAYTLNVDTWYHIAVVRDGANIKIYINGDLGLTAAVGAFTFPSIGTALPGARTMWQVARFKYNGYRTADPVGWKHEVTNMDVYSFRLTLDTPRYTSTFTAPNKPFPLGPGSAAQL